MKGFIRILVVAMIAVMSVGVSLFLLNAIEVTAQGDVHFPHSVINESYILIDDFSDEKPNSLDWNAPITNQAKNNLDGRNACYDTTQDNSLITCTVNTSQNFVEMQYATALNGSAWLQMDLGLPGQFGALSSMDAVWIVIKGDKGGETVFAEFKNCGIEEEFYPKVNMNNYITKEWRAIVIPFSDIANSPYMSDPDNKWSWECIDRFTLVVTGTGKIYVNEVRFLASNTLIDDYNDSFTTNELGGKSSAWMVETALITPILKNDHLELSYLVPNGTIGGGYWTNLISTNLVAKRGNLLFDIRGAKGGEKIITEFSDCSTGVYTHFPKIRVADYHPNGRITNEWRTVGIPLVAFVDMITDIDKEGIDWNCIEQFTFNVTGVAPYQSGQGTVYIDNVKLVPVDYPTGLIPVWVDHFHDCDTWNALNQQWLTGTVGAEFTVSTDSTNDFSSFGCAYKLIFDLQQLGQYSWVAAPLKGLNASNYRRLQFYVKGKEGGEDVFVTLRDQNNNKHLIAKKATTDWQIILISLADFTDVDTSNLKELVFSFEDGIKSGEIYLDNIRFIPYYTYLPLIFNADAMPPITELSVFNDNTGGDVTFTVRDLEPPMALRCTVTVSNNDTKECKPPFPPGTYKIEVVAACGTASTIKTYETGPQTTRVFCQQ